MGRLNLRRNVGEAVIVQTPLGSLEVHVDSTTERSVGLSFQGVPDYSVFREEVKNKALQNFGAYLTQYSWNGLQGTVWGNRTNFNCYDLRNSLVKSEFEFVRNIPQFKNLYQDNYSQFPNCVCGFIERSLYEYRIIAGVQTVVVLGRITCKAYVLHLTPITAYAMTSFCNSLPFKISTAELSQLGFKSSSLDVSEFQLAKVDFYA